uniref:Uncharacterized protein n=1 Tax=Leersia perrieri TaxID=77586 RepID=A0A0D9X424_9ORYZ
MGMLTKILAKVIGNEGNEIVLQHDSKVVGFLIKLGDHEYVELTHHIVAVPLDGHLVLNVTILFEGDHENECV